MDLTKRQKEIFDFIRKYAAKYGYPPTVREIGKAVGLHSSSTVHAHLANLEKIGLLRRDPTKPRAIELLVDKAKKAIRPIGLPLVGEVAAGQPVLAEERIEEYLEVPDVIGGESGDYILRIKGDSMKDAGIIEGDYVVVHPADDRRRRRDRRRRDRGRGDREALLPRRRRRSPAARERRLQADRHHRGTRPRQGDGSVPEGLSVSATATSERHRLRDRAARDGQGRAAPLRARKQPGRWANARGRRPRRLGGAHRPGARGVPRLLGNAARRGRLPRMRLRAQLRCPRGSAEPRSDIAVPRNRGSYTEGRYTSSYNRQARSTSTRLSLNVGASASGLSACGVVAWLLRPSA